MSESEIEFGLQFSTLVKKEDVDHILDCQTTLLTKLEKTNEMLHTINELSEHRIGKLAADMKANTRLLVSVKRELGLVLRRIENCKKILQKSFPDEYLTASSEIYAAWEAELEHEEETVLPSPTTRKMATLNEEQK